MLYIEVKHRFPFIEFKRRGGEHRLLKEKNERIALLTVVKMTFFFCSCCLLDFSPQKFG